MVVRVDSSSVVPCPLRGRYCAGVVGGVVVAVVNVMVVVVVVVAVVCMVDLQK